MNVVATVVNYSDCPMSSVHIREGQTHAPILVRTRKSDRWKKAETRYTVIVFTTAKILVVNSHLLSDNSFISKVIIFEHNPHSSLAFRLVSTQQLHRGDYLNSFV